jgi:hypothetical protein
VAHLSLGECGTFHVANPRPASLADIVAAMSDNGVSLVPRPGVQVGPDVFKATGIVFDRRNTLAGLAGGGIACPEPTRELLGKYVRAALNA